MLLLDVQWPPVADGFQDRVLDMLCRRVVSREAILLKLDMNNRNW